jgi:hypothetical protein
VFDHRLVKRSRPIRQPDRPTAAKHTGDVGLDLLADVLGAEVIAIGPVDSPLPVTGRCSRCGSSTTIYGPSGHPLCDLCRSGVANP